MTIKACRKCGSRDLNKLPGGDLGRESFHCRSCGAMGEPRDFNSEGDYHEFMKSIKLSKMTPARKDEIKRGFLKSHYKQIIAFGLLAIILVFIVAGASVIYMVVKHTIPDAENTTTIEVTCDPPFVAIGGSCCVDGNKNSVCDIEEVETTVKQTTSVKAATTVATETTMPTSTVATTLDAATSTPTTVEETTIPTTSTIQPPATTTIKCVSNSDCGKESVKYVCQFGVNIYEIHEIPTCDKPGTEGARCIVKQKGANPYESRTLVLTCKDPKKCVPGEKLCAKPE